MRFIVEAQEKRLNAEDNRALIRVLFGVIMLLFMISGCNTKQHTVSSTAMEISSKEQKKRLREMARVERKAERKYKSLNNYKNGYYKPFYRTDQADNEDIFDMHLQMFRPSKNYYILFDKP